jgi:uroporphyrinogen decarboxylase
MTSRERIYKTIKGEPTDRTPVALWRHFPDSDQTSQGLAASTIDFQKKFDFDLVKVMPASGFMIEVFGGKFIPLKTGLSKGIRECIDFPVKDHTDWKKLKPIDMKHKILARELEALKLIRKGVGNDVPIIQTIPNPLTLAKTLRGEAFFDDLRNHPADLEPALAAITETLLNFSLESLKAGADGMFFFTQTASFDLLTEEEYKKFGVKYDLEILNALKKQNALLVLHIHGLNIMFDLLKDYPVQIINWHDQLTAPTIAEAQKISDKTFLGGVEENEMLLKESPRIIKSRIKNIASDNAGARLIFGPGCVLPIETPEINIAAVKKALEN